jgi:hypothetical protein
VQRTLPLWPSNVWFMDKLLGAATPVARVSLSVCDSSFKTCEPRSQSFTHDFHASAASVQSTLTTKRIKHTFSMPFSPPHAIQPCSKFQETQRNLTPLGMAIWHRKFHNNQEDNR